MPIGGIRFTPLRQFISRHLTVCPYMVQSPTQPAAIIASHVKSLITMSAQPTELCIKQREHLTHFVNKFFHELAERHKPSIVARFRFHFTIVEFACNKAHERWNIAAINKFLQRRVTGDVQLGL